VPDAVAQRRETRRARPIVDLAVVVVVAPPAGIVVGVLMLVMRHIGAAPTRRVLCRSGSHRTTRRGAVRGTMDFSLARDGRRRLCNRAQSAIPVRGTLVSEGGMMLNALTRTRVIQIWFVVVAVAIAAGIAFGVAVTTSTGVLLLAGCLVPPAIVLLLWRDAPPPTVAEVIHAADGR